MHPHHEQGCQQPANVVLDESERSDAHDGDFENLDDVLTQLADLDRCERLAEAAFEVASARCTYNALITPLLAEIDKVARQTS